MTIGAFYSRFFLLLALSVYSRNVLSQSGASSWPVLFYQFGPAPHRSANHTVWIVTTNGIKIRGL